MLNTKLILIDGITGSGKSTLSHFLYRQMQKNNMQVKWLHEEEKDHPLVYKPNWAKELTTQEKTEIYLKEYVELWGKFAEEVKQSGSVYIVESYLFQYPFATLIRQETDKSRIKEFGHALIKQVEQLNPVVIYLYPQDVETGINLNFTRRGKDWTEWILSKLESTEHAKKRNWDGQTEANYYYQSLSDISLELMKEFTLPKMSIENSRQDWDLYRKEMLQFLEIPFREEILLRPEDVNYCGEYSKKFADGNEMKYLVYIQENRLCIDAFWPGLKLISVSGDEFSIEGYPFKLFFKKDAIDKVKQLTISKDLFQQEEDWVLERLEN